MSSELAILEEKRKKCQEKLEKITKEIFIIENKLENFEKGDTIKEGKSVYKNCYIECLRGTFKLFGYRARKDGSLYVNSCEIWLFDGVKIVKEGKK